MEYLLVLWGTHGWWLLMLPVGGALVVLFLLAEIFQLAIQGRRWWVALLAFFAIIVVAACIGYPLWLAGVQPGWAVWIPLVGFGAMYVAAMLAEVRIVRRWIHQDKWPRNGVVRANRLNVRDKPDGAFVRRLNRGDYVLVISQSRGWYQIRKNEWVAATYIELLS